MDIKIVVHEAVEGGFWAEAPALPGCASQGESLNELTANMREAIAGWLGTPVRTVFLVATLLAALAVPAAAQSTFRTTPPQARPEASGNAPALQAVIDCRRQTDPAARLACFDAAAARLEQAESAGEVVVVDRSQVREARRQIFGFSVPALDLFGRGTNRAEDRVDSLEGVVASSSVGRDGKRVIRLQDGAVWRQYGAEEIRVRSGSRALITRGLIGSYFMRVDNQPGVRVQRVQ